MAVVSEDLDIPPVAPVCPLKEPLKYSRLLQCLNNAFRDVDLSSVALLWLRRVVAEDGCDEVFYRQLSNYRTHMLAASDALKEAQPLLMDIRTHENPCPNFCFTVTKRVSSPPSVVLPCTPNTNTTTTMH